MNDLLPAPVLDLSTEWLNSHREALIKELSRPSAPRRARALGLAGVGTAAAAAATTVLALGGGGTVNAFADWSPSPTVPGDGQISSALAYCQARLAQDGPVAYDGAVSGPYQPVLEDVRGPFTTTVLEDPAEHLVYCLTDPGDTSLHWAALPPESLPADAISVEQAGQRARQGQVYTRIFGRVGSSVSGVALTLSDGSQVRSTVGHGLFLAWWPGGIGVTLATITAADGTTTRHLGIPGPQQPAGTASKN